MDKEEIMIINTTLLALKLTFDRNILHFRDRIVDVHLNEKQWN